MTSNDSESGGEGRRLLALAATLRPAVDPARLRCVPLARTRNSRVYEISDGATLRWAAKVCVDPRTRAPSPEAARVQFDALRVLRDRTRDARVELGRPDPVHLDEAAAVVVMSWVDGESLTAELRRWPRAETTLAQHMQEAGRWLALLHIAGLGSADALPTQRKLTGMRDVLALETARDEVFRRGAALLERRAADAAMQAHPTSWVHGDCKPDNILFAGDRPSGIDMHLRDVGSVLEDVAPFLNNVEIQCAMLRAWRSSMQRAALVKLFLDGYSAMLGPLPLMPLAWMRLYSALSLWGYDMTTARNPLKAQIAHQLYRRLAERLTVHLEAISQEVSTG